MKDKTMPEKEIDVTDTTKNDETMTREATQQDELNTL